jgi:hypothetical protein
MMFSLALSSPVAGNSACKATFKLMKTFQVLHSSKYVTPCFDEPMTDRDMAKRVMDFMGDCKDITLEDRLSCAIDLKELEHLIVQVFNNQHEDTDLCLWIDLVDGANFRPFATVYVRQPSEVDVYQAKLDQVRVNAEKMREGFAKCKSSEVEEGLKAIESLVA